MRVEASVWMNAFERNAYTLHAQCDKNRNFNRTGKEKEESMIATVKVQLYIWTISTRFYA